MYGFLFSAYFLETEDLNLTLYLHYLRQLDTLSAIFVKIFALSITSMYFCVE